MQKKKSLQLRKDYIELSFPLHFSCFLAPVLVYLFPLNIKSYSTMFLSVLNIPNFSLSIHIPFAMFS